MHFAVKSRSENRAGFLLRILNEGAFARKDEQAAPSSASSRHLFRPAFVFDAVMLEC